MKTRHFIYKENGEIKEVSDFLPMQKTKEDGFYISDLINNNYDNIKEIFTDIKFFNTRKELNMEMATLIDIEKSFLQNFKIIRNEFKIPYLEPEDDIELISIDENGKEIILTKSKYLDSIINKKEKGLIQNKIKWLLERYNLPLNFKDWIQYYLLYNKKPNWVPLYNWEIIDQIISDKNEALRIPLTTEEKKYIKAQFRKVFSMEKGRPTKKLKEKYNELLSIFKKSKNSLRRSGAFEDISHILDKGDKTYEQVAEDIAKYNLVASGEDLDKLKKFDIYLEKEKVIQALRKQKERLKKRIDLLFNSKPKK